MRGKERNRRHTLRTSQKAALPVRCPAFLQSQSDSFPSFFLPSPLRAASKRLDMWTFGQLLSALLPRRFPARPLHSETVNKWVGLQPNGNEGKQRGLFGVLLNICIGQAVLPHTHKQQTTRWKINISLSEITDFFFFFSVWKRREKRERQQKIPFPVEQGNWHRVVLFVSEAAQI